MRGEFRAKTTPDCCLSLDPMIDPYLHQGSVIRKTDMPLFVMGP